MAERSFKAEVEHLRLGAGDTFTGEGILAITKALLENGVGYVGGYQGAPISHLMDVLADATNTIAEGKVLQLMNCNDPQTSEQQYMDVIYRKTAKLFEASARLAAILAKTSSDMEEACATYGQALGTAFQVIDDVLDYDGSPTEMGKNLGDDLREGKRTVLVATAVEAASPSPLS